MLSAYCTTTTAACSRYPPTGESEIVYAPRRTLACTADSEWSHGVFKIHARISLTAAGRPGQENWCVPLLHGLHQSTTAQWAPQHAGYGITLECCRSRHIIPAVLCRIDCCRCVCTTAVGRVAGCKRTGQQWVGGGHSGAARCQAKGSAAGSGALPSTLARIHSAVTLAIRPRCLRSTSHSLGLDRALFVC